MILPKDVGLNESDLNLKVIDLLNRNNNLMTCEKLRSQPNWNTNILYINSLLVAIPKAWKAKINNNAFIFQEIPCFGLVINKSIIPISNVTSRKVYWDTVKSKAKKKKKKRLH